MLKALAFHRYYQFDSKTLHLRLKLLWVFVFVDALRVLLSFAFTFDVKIQFNLDLIETLGKEYSLISSGGKLTVSKYHTTSKKFDSNILTCPASIS